jgi:hypothetical protein
MKDRDAFAASENPGKSRNANFEFRPWNLCAGESKGSDNGERHDEQRIHHKGTDQTS